MTAKVYVSIPSTSLPISLDTRLGIRSMKHPWLNAETATRRWDWQGLERWCHFLHIRVWHTVCTGTTRTRNLGALVVIALKGGRRFVEYCGLDLHCGGPVTSKVREPLKVSRFSAVLYTIWLLLIILTRDGKSRLPLNRCQWSQHFATLGFLCSNTAERFTHIKSSWLHLPSSVNASISPPS